MSESDRSPQPESDAPSCPKCGWQVGQSTECARCGVIVAKAATAARVMDTAEVVVTSSGGGRLTTLVLLLVFGAVAIFAFGNAPESEAERSEPSETLAELAPAERSASLPRARKAPSYSADDYQPVFESTSNDADEAASVRATESKTPATYSYDWFEGANGFRDGIELAKKENRPVLLYFYTDWCGYCRQLEGNLLEHGTVEDYTKNLVKIRINPEKGNVERQLAQRYGVRGFPSLFMHATTSAKPKKISRTSGKRLKRPAEFVDTLKRAAGR